MEEQKFGEDYRPTVDVADEEEVVSYRYRWMLFVLVGLTLVIAAFLLILSPQAEEYDTGPSEVAATIFPIYDITRNVAGDAVGVALLLPPGSSPHTFDPTPAQVASLRDVQLYFAVGHGLDDWADGMFDLLVKKEIVDDGLAIISTEDRHREGHDLGDEDHEDHEDEEDGHGHGTLDPHYWLSIKNAKQIARTIERRLVEEFPEHETTFERNLEKYLERLDIAEADVRDTFSDVQNRDMITLHDSWYYFAVAYGFDIAGTFEPSAGREPTPRYLADLAATVDRIGAETLYSEPQVATQGIEPFARDNGLEIVVLDPIGGTEGNDSFIDLMRSNARIIRNHQD